MGLGGIYTGPRITRSLTLGTRKMLLMLTGNYLIVILHWTKYLSPLLGSVPAATVSSTLIKGALLN